MQQDQSYGRQAFVHNSNSTNRHRALYIYNAPSVLWALLSAQQDQRYGRQTIGHYSNSTNRHTALYIYNVPSVVWALLSLQQGQRYCRQTIGHYSSNRHTALYIYRAAQTVSAVQLLSAVHTEVIESVYTLCVKQSTFTVLNRSTVTSSCSTEANITLH